MRSEEDRLRDILEAIDAILNRAGADRARFDRDEMLRVWCLHHLLIIGEAAAGLADEFRLRHSAPPWRMIVGMRNAIVHGYFQVDWEEVWVVVSRDLPVLRRSILEIFREEGWPAE